MPPEYTITRRVEFAETDMAGIAHFTNFFRWMEEAEHAFFRSLGHSVSETRCGEDIGWPRLSASCEYLKPARFEDVLEVRMRVQEKGRKSLTLAFSFQKNGEEIARGQLVTVCCRCSPGRPLEAIPIPDEIRSKIDRR
ncbi:MAG: acyl-CoA thioesterase [Planctomycetes bacterium]|nr:acyl-CoA thioesterase [Planctomycetota bacterium]